MFSVPLEPCRSTLGWAKRGPWCKSLNFWAGLVCSTERPAGKGQGCFVFFGLHVPALPQLAQTPGLSQALGMAWKHGLGLFCLFLGRFSLHPQPDAPSDGEPVQWVNILWALERFAGHHGDLLQQNSPCVRSPKPTSSDHGAGAIPISLSSEKFHPSNVGWAQPSPCYICNTSFGLYSNQWLAHKAPTNLFISYLLCKYRHGEARTGSMHTRRVHTPFLQQ